MFAAIRRGIQRKWLVLAGLLAGGLLLEHAARGDEPGKTAGAKKEIAVRDLKLSVPATWTQKEVQSQFRAGELAIPPAEGDATPGELVVFYFGEQGAGAVEANVARWVGQFEQEGRQVKVFTGTAGDRKYILVDVQGTYKKPIGPPIQMKSEKKPGWRVLGVILNTDKGPYFLKLDGPQKTIAGVATAYREAFGGDPKAEKEQKPAAQE